MDEIQLSYRDSNFFLEGAIGERFECRGASPKADSGQALNFYRIDNNFGYVTGRISFSDDCDNNLIISDQIETTISKTRNSLIIIYNGNLDIFPIREVEDAYSRCLDLLNRKTVIYNTPKKVLKRERLKKKSSKDLENIFIENYGIHPTQIIKIEESAKRNGIFYVSDSLSRYIFKYLGENKEMARAIFKVAESMPDLFPARRKTIEGDVAIHLEDGLYGLEEFIQGERNKIRDVQYFSELGENIAMMHEKLSQLTKNNPNLRTPLLSQAKHLSESNLVSLGIDLGLKGFKNFNSEINQFAELELSKEVNSLPEYLIHGDLNRSNVIATSNSMKFIDLETLKISRRVLELESPLIFGGNMSVPFYFKGSFKSLIESYNRTAQSPLTDREQKLGRVLLRYALIKNFVIRNIRRGEKANNKENLLTNLSCLDMKLFGNS